MNCFKLRHTIQIHISVCVAKQNLLLDDFTKISSSMLKAQKLLCYVTVGTLSRLEIVSPIGNVALRVLVLGSE